MEYIPVGVIVNTHGLKGTLKVQSTTDFKEQRYQKGQTLYIVFRGTHVPVTVDSYRTKKNIDMIDFVEFTDINQCEKYKGCDLVISEDDIHELPEDEFYFDELIGMRVVSDTMEGTVVHVREMPRGPLLVVDTSNKQLLIPFQKEFIQSVDKATNTITIIEWEGLI